MSIPALIARVEKARIKGATKDIESRAKRLLQSYLQTAIAHGVPVNVVIAEMSDGTCASRIGGALRDALMQAPPAEVRNAACAAGCAFCCILTDDVGGVITAAEAKELHEAVAQLQGAQSGQDWHPKACAALDPQTRTCRAYAARPTICRSFISTDADACAKNAEGGAEQGAGLIGTHLDYLTLHGLCRAVLKGITTTPTYSLAAVTQGALRGEQFETTAKTALHKTPILDQMLKEAVTAARA